MRIAGGVIALIVGIIQTIVSALAVFAVGVVSSLADSAAGANAQTAQAVAEAQGTVAAVTFWVYISLAVGLLTFVFGILALSQKTAINGVVIIVLGAVGVVMAILGGGGVLTLLWPGLIVLAGLLAFFGAKQQPATV